MKIAVIGCGNMASPVVEAIYKDNTSIEFHTYTPSQKRAIKLSEKVNGVHHKTLDDFPTDIKFWILAFKPQQLAQFAKENNKLLHGTNIISILAATPVKTLKDKLKTKFVTRVMPNTPSLHGEGIELILHSEDVPLDNREKIEKMFKSCGYVYKVSNEEQFEQMTTITGSGPAYVYEFAKAYQEKLKSFGIDEDMSRKLVVQLFKGSTILMENSSDHLQVMIDKVTSKAGVTIEAIDYLRDQGVENTISESINKAVARSNEITQELT